MKSLIITLLLASVFSLSAQAEEAKPKDQGQKMNPSKMDHSKMKDHGKMMDHGKMEHGKMGHGDGHSHADSKATAEKVGSDKLLVKVNGMVCAFCAQGIEKNFNAKPAVKNTKVDLDTMEVLITLKEGKSLSEKEIKEVVTNAGFTFVGMKK